MESRVTNTVIGACVGGFLGWIVGNILADHFAPEYYFETEEEKDSYFDQLKKYGYDDASNEPTGRIDYTKMKKKPLRMLAEKYPEEGEGTISVNGQDIEDYEDLEGISDDLSYEEYLQTFGDNSIRLMSDEEWEDASETDMVETVLRYYPVDDVLTDNENKPLKSVEKIIGEEALTSFGLYNDSEDTVYVWNKGLNCRYKIIQMIDKSYEEDVLGGTKSKKKATKKVNVFEEAEKEEKEVDDD